MKRRSWKIHLTILFHLTTSPPSRRRSPPATAKSQTMKILYHLTRFFTLNPNPISISHSSNSKALIDSIYGRTLSIENKIKSSSLGIKAQWVGTLIPQPPCYVSVTILKQEGETENLPFQKIWICRRSFHASLLALSLSFHFNLTLLLPFSLLFLPSSLCSWACELCVFVSDFYYESEVMGVMEWIECVFEREWKDEWIGRMVNLVKNRV